MMMMETFCYSALQGQMEVKELIWTESKFQWNTETEFNLQSISLSHSSGLNYLVHIL